MIKVGFRSINNKVKFFYYLIILWACFHPSLPLPSINYKLTTIHVDCLFKNGRLPHPTAIQLGTFNVHFILIWVYIAMFVFAFRNIRNMVKPKDLKVQTIYHESYYICLHTHANPCYFSCYVLFLSLINCIIIWWLMFTWFYHGRKQTCSAGVYFHSIRIQQLYSNIHAYIIILIKIYSFSVWLVHILSSCWIKSRQQFSASSME